MVLCFLGDWILNLPGPDPPRWQSGLIPGCILTKWILSILKKPCKVGFCMSEKALLICFLQPLSPNSRTGIQFSLNSNKLPTIQSPWILPRLFQPTCLPPAATEPLITGRALSPFIFLSSLIDQQLPICSFPCLSSPFSLCLWEVAMTDSPR